MSKRTPYASLILLIWMVVVVAALGFAEVSATEELSPRYDTMVAAARLSDRAMEAVKQRKQELGIPLSAYDTLQTGMIGERYTPITTTIGVLEAKRTTTNPNWAAVVVGMFVKAGLKAGDRIAMVFSGSFPAMNISAMAAAEAYGLKTAVMASVGASSYGANDVDFTFFDMASYLKDAGILTGGVDYVSFGGADDTGLELAEEDRQRILARIQASGTVFISESDFEKNIRRRIAYLEQDKPGIKFLLNVGGSLVGLGYGNASFHQFGYVAPGYTNTQSAFPGFVLDSGTGLLEYYYRQGVPVANILNIKQIASGYGIPYDPAVMPEIGVGKAYYALTYNIWVPTAALVLSAAVLIFYYFYKKKNGVSGGADERNYILCRR